MNIRSSWDPFDNSQIKSDLKGRSIRGGIFTFSGQALAFIINLIRIFVLARLLTPNDFGLIAMVLTITSFIMVLKDAGLSMATIQRESVTHEQVSFLFWVNLTIGCLLGVALLLLSPAIAWFYKEPELWRVSAALSVTFPLSSLIIQHQALLRRHMRFGRLLFVQIVVPVVSLVVVIVCVAFGMGYWALVMSLITTPLINAGLVWFLVPWLPGRFRRGIGCKEMLWFGGHLTIDSFLKKFLEVYPDVLVGRIYAASALGFYSKAKQLLLIPLRRALSPFQAVAVPALSRLADNPDRYRVYFNSQWLLFRCFIVPVFCCAIVMYDWIIDIALGPGWESAQILFLLSSIGAMFNFGIWPVSFMMITQGRSRDVLRLSFVRFPLRILACSIGAFYSLEWLIGLDALALFLMVFVLIWVGGRTGPIGRRELLYGYTTYIISLLLAISLSWLLRLLLMTLDIYEPVLIVLVFTSCLFISGLVVFARSENRKAINTVVSNIAKQFNVKIEFMPWKLTRL